MAAGIGKSYFFLNLSEHFDSWDLICMMQLFCIIVHMSKRIPMWIYVCAECISLLYLPTHIHHRSG